MKKCLYPGLLLLTFFLIFSCKRVDLTSRYAYNVNKDTIAPVLALTVPVALDTYTYGEDIHIVGTATDLESITYSNSKAGKLKSLYLNVSVIDPLQDTVIKVLLAKWPAVDGKNGVTINEKTKLNGGPGTSYCRLIGVATDYSDRRDSISIDFTVN